MHKSDMVRMVMLKTLFVCLFLLIRTNPSTAAWQSTEVIQEAENIEEWIVDIRRKLHQYPELMYHVRGSARQKYCLW